MKLLSLKLLISLFFLILFVRPIFAQTTEYFFQEEFNLERPAQTLDPDKWIVYPNRNPNPDFLGCLVDTVKETGGVLILKQCRANPQFPYVVSKNNPFPNGNFDAEVRFQFTSAGGLSTGVHFVDTAPANGAGFTNLFGISIEEDRISGLAMRLEYKDSPVFTTPTNSGFHVLKVVKENQIYKLYFDNNLVFTSPETQEKVQAIIMGNPAILPSPGFDWSWPRIDYIRVINSGPSQIAPEPFLDLPWDYESNEMTFNEAATSINAYFDHEYPLLSAGLNEPTKLISFRGGTANAELDYSSHDGYDYGSPAKTKLGTPLLAPADGKATYMKSCTACGNAILVDHENGYQTRYYHLKDEGLVTNEAGKEVEVKKGDKIGEVGYTGNVDPDGEQGAHLHFMVIQDKDGDGDFADNIPDGIVDPFGWQSSEPDPWENYQFKIGEENKTGNKSYYLFTKKLDNLNESLDSNAKVFTVGKTTLDFPQGTTDQNLNLTLQSEPNFTDELLNSLGSVINIEAKNTAGQLVTNFLKSFFLTINFSQFDLNRYNLDTLSIYSSTDGENWTKENTQIDLNNKTATTSVNHLTYFALMAKRKDTIAPATTPILEGEKGTDNNFRSDVKVNLNAVDNEGGLGVEFTAYSIGEAGWKTYSSPLSFTEEGNHKVYFYSQDNDGNIEEIKSVEFSIDKTVPEARIEVDQSDWDLKVLPVASDSAVTKVPGAKNKTIYKISDSAGNTLTLDTYHLDRDNIDVFKLYSLKYNSSPATQASPNLLDTNYIDSPPGKKPVVKIINQNFNYKDKALFVILADAVKGKTTLNIIENKKPRKEEKAGVVLLKLQTNKGKLEYSY